MRRSTAILAAYGLCFVADLAACTSLWAVSGRLIQCVERFEWRDAVFDLAAAAVVRVTVLAALHGAYFVHLRKAVAAPEDPETASKLRVLLVFMALVPTLFVAYGVAKMVLMDLQYRYHTVAWCTDGFAVPEALMALSIAFPLAYVAFAACASLLRRQMEKEHALGCGDARRENGEREPLLGGADAAAKHEDGAKAKRPRGPGLRRLITLARPEYPIISVGLVMLVIAAGTNLLIPTYFGKIIEAVARSTIDPDAQQEAKRELDDAIVRLLIILIGNAFASALRAWLFELAGQRFVARIRSDLFNAIIQQEVAFFDENRTGDLTNRLASDTQVLQNAATVNISMLLRYSVQVIGSLVFMFIISWKLTLTMLAIVPLVSVGAVLYGRFVRDLQKKFQDELAKSSSTAEEAISNIRTVRSFANENVAERKYYDDIMKSYAIGRRTAVAAGGWAGVVGMLFNLSMALVLWYGGVLVVTHNLTVGQLTSFMLYTITLAAALAFISSLYGNFMQAVGASVAIFRLLDRRAAIPVSGGRVLPHLDGEIGFRGVTFHYPSRPDSVVLREVNLRVPVGTVCALVGPSGGGKSTVVSLIERFYDPVGGDVLVDGMDIRELDPKWYRRQVALVSQEPTLFALSIRDNIAYGRPDASMAEIEEAARQANALVFIDSFKERFDTLVGERGVKLSGGQKQRIAIARALLMDPKILLLDEATSALDAESEHLVQEAIDRAMVHRTVIVIAHRLSTVRTASQVLVLDKGGIVERGTHDELIARRGVYERLVRRQMVGDERAGDGYLLLDDAATPTPTPTTTAAASEDSLHGADADDVTDGVHPEARLPIADESVVDAADA